MIQIQVTVGELLDRVSILELKARTRPKARAELDVLMPIAAPYIDQVPGLYAQLFETNAELWRLEDVVRSMGDSTPEWFLAARSVPIANDRRADLRRQINRVFNDDHESTKSYGGA